MNKEELISCENKDCTFYNEKRLEICYFCSKCKFTDSALEEKTTGKRSDSVEPYPFSKDRYFNTVSILPINKNNPDPKPKVKEEVKLTVSMDPKNFDSTDNYEKIEDEGAAEDKMDRELIDLIDTDKALRYNEGKAKWSLVHYESLVPMIKVLEFGALKYAPKNWMKPMDETEILESMQRHLAALMDGEEFDQESGVSHMGHIQCNAMFYNYHHNLNNKKKNG